MAAIRTMDEKFAHEVGDVYDAEHRFLEGMREMLDAASDAKVKKLLKAHIRQSEGQIVTLEQVYQLIGKKPKRVKCAASAGLVAEASKSLEDAEENPAIRDCLIAGASAKAEHYEIVSYRGLIATAEVLGLAEAVPLLQEILQQEVETAALVEESAPELLRKALNVKKKAVPRKAKAKSGPVAESESDGEADAV